MRTIAIGTGAAGETLEGLKDSFNAVFSTVPQSADTVATVLADLNTVTAATGPTKPGSSGEARSRPRMPRRQTGRRGGTIRARGWPRSRRRRSRFLQP